MYVCVCYLVLRAFQQDFIHSFMEKETSPKLSNSLKATQPGGASGKEHACQCRRHRLHLWIRKNPEEGHGNPLQHSCLENPMVIGAWQATVHGVAKSWTQLKWLSKHAQNLSPWFKPLNAKRNLKRQNGYLGYEDLFCGVLCILATSS